VGWPFVHFRLLCISVEHHPTLLLDTLSTTTHLERPQYSLSQTINRMARTVISNKPAARVVAKRVSLRINKPNPASTKAAAPKRLIDTSILDYFSRTSSPPSARIKVKSKELEGTIPSSLPPPLLLSFIHPLSVTTIRCCPLLTEAHSCPRSPAAHRAPEPSWHAPSRRRRHC